jgi:hypothetical protein
LSAPSAAADNRATLTTAGAHTVFSQTDRESRISKRNSYGIDARQVKG